MTSSNMGLNGGHSVVLEDGKRLLPEVGHSASREFVVDHYDSGRDHGYPQLPLSAKAGVVASASRTKESWKGRGLKTIQCRQLPMPFNNS